MSIIPALNMPTERLLTSKEVAILFRMDPKTIARWARKGRLEAIRTPGGRVLRFRESDVTAALQAPAADQENDADQANDTAVVA